MCDMHKTRSDPDTSRETGNTSIVTYPRTDWELPDSIETRLCNHLHRIRHDDDTGSTAHRDRVAK
jgi:hypothetical protein